MTDQAYEYAARLLADIEAITEERKVQHGGVTDEFFTLSIVWSALLNRPIPPELACTMMAAAKIVRIAVGDSALKDHYLDGANYLALAWGLSRHLTGEHNETA